MVASTSILVNDSMCQFLSLCLGFPESCILNILEYGHLYFVLVATRTNLIPSHSSKPWWKPRFTAIRRDQVCTTYIRKRGCVIKHPPFAMVVGEQAITDPCVA